jgi:hypothetical protein
VSTAKKAAFISKNIIMNIKIFIKILKKEKKIARFDWLGWISTYPNTPVVGWPFEGRPQTGCVLVRQRYAGGGGGGSEQAYATSLESEWE